MEMIRITPAALQALRKEVVTGQIPVCSNLDEAHPSDLPEAPRSFREAFRIFELQQLLTHFP